MTDENDPLANLDRFPAEVLNAAADLVVRAYGAPVRFSRRYRLAAQILDLIHAELTHVDIDAVLDFIARPRTPPPPGGTR